ncbi:MarR family winged helix-turn-helix transcriptional regulator [Halioxenophilus sp. WMMB6]|uniref:MarR family winged helix-turn-helix transcriptional regulator n=1 Tax=Halioxenophilus sp. WMMB6 TaxID=3073815 RepID=UPI00295F596E|nr:MarR family winged helix-turn-helix transcriptional regulator [Halioxenophilus sp. WMMB6]
MPKDTTSISVTKVNKNSNQDEVINRNTLEDKLGFRIRMAERAIYKSFVQQVGMTPVQYSVFTLVADNEGMSQGVIGEALNLDRASTMAIMDKLESSGLVERRKSPIDRRRYALYLTAKGRQEIVTTEAKVKATDEQFKQRLSDKQLQELIRCLSLIRQD